MPSLQLPSGRLRKYIPQPEQYAARYGGFILTRRDYEILDLVYRYRHLEARHIRALIPGSDQQITRRLQGLFHNKYIGRYAPRHRMRLELDPGPPVVAYGLELMGARALDQIRRSLHSKGQGATPPPVRWRKEYTRRSEWFLEHHLMVANFHCILELALRGERRTDLLNWSQGREVWFQARIPDVQSRIRVAPDAYFTLRTGNRVRHFFLEADRSTEEHKKIHRKIAGYWWYLQSEEFARIHGDDRRANVLFVTTGRERLHNLIRTVCEWNEPLRANHAGRSMFMLTTDERFSVTRPGPILDNAWLTAKSGTRSLLP